MKKKEEIYDSSHSNCYDRAILINDKPFLKFRKKTLKTKWKYLEKICWIK